MSEVDSVADMPVRDMRKKDCLLEIGRILGYNSTDRNALSKRMMNSTVWYITGSEEVYRGWFGTERSPQESRMRVAVGEVVGFPFPAGGQQRHTSPFRRNQLRAIVIALRESEDNRWDE